MINEPVSGNFRFYPSVEGKAYQVEPEQPRPIPRSEYGIVNPYAHLGQDIATAYDPFAPIDEVEDAGQRIARMYAGNENNVAPGMRELLSQYAALQRIERHAEDVIAKALRLRDGDDAKEGKAHTESWGSEFGRGYFKWFSKVGVQMPILRAFARRLEVHQAILRTRKRQIDRFSRPSRAIDHLGWRLVMRDEEAVPMGDILEQIKWLTRVLECGGREFNPVERRRKKRQGMTQFLRFLCHDGLELDHAAVELIGLNGSDGLDSWYVRPSETFAFANPRYADKIKGEEVYAYQVLNGRDEVPFAFDELAIFQRNQSTWAEENGYGYGEFEQTLDTINNILQAVTYTKQGLNENAIPRGILMAYGNFDHRTQQNFQTAWQQKVRGIQNQFGLPILFSRGQQGAMQYLQTGEPFDEMAFAKWISFNWTVASAIYGVSPEEIGMEGFTVDKSNLSGSDTSEKLASAKDKGLHPFLKDISGYISDEIIYRFSPELKLEFTGLDALNTEEKWKEKVKHMTINEVRAIFDLPPHPLGWFGDLPADAGEQGAEFQRMQVSATFGEIRKMWGQLPEYPSEMMNISPINAALGGLFMQAIMVPPGETEGEENETEGQEGETERPEVEMGEEDKPDFAGIAQGRLEQMDLGQNKPADEEEEKNAESKKAKIAPEKGTENLPYGS